MVDIKGRLRHLLHRHHSASSTQTLSSVHAKGNSSSHSTRGTTPITDHHHQQHHQTDQRHHSAADLPSLNKPPSTAQTDHTDLSTDDAVARAGQTAAAGKLDSSHLSVDDAQPLENTISRSSNPRAPSTRNTDSIAEVEEQSEPDTRAPEDTREREKIADAAARATDTASQQDADRLRPAIARQESSKSLPSSSADHVTFAESKQPAPPASTKTVSIADHRPSDDDEESQQQLTDRQRASSDAVSNTLTIGAGNGRRIKHTRAGSSRTLPERRPPSITERPELTIADSQGNTVPLGTADQTFGMVQTPQPVFQGKMGARKVWVRRPGATATLINIREDDMVDEAKDMILRKYGNSLGRHFDAPDVTIRIIPRGHGEEFALRPDELLCRALDKHFPGRQAFEEAIIVHVPQRRTPKPSPGAHTAHSHHHHHILHAEDPRPLEGATDYFPPMPPVALSPGPSVLHAQAPHVAGVQPIEARSMSVLTTGYVPPLASPGGTRRAPAPRSHKPSLPRTHTTSPTTLAASTSSRAPRPRNESNASDRTPLPASLATCTAMPTPPAEAGKVIAAVSSPVPRTASPRPSKLKKRQKTSAVNANSEDAAPQLLPPIIDTSMPPINVLIVEDNMINMRLLEQFVRRLKVHWATAVNGREAVQKWRQGGFHLVLMDIQLPIMSGLDATREIRRLEKVNHIGVLSGSSHSSVPPALPAGSAGAVATAAAGAEGNGSDDDKEVKEQDRLGDTARLFKSPVIIVALTASNLQSDRHEALAAGCNDFLTKPVNFVWFERKVKEWGCMQALIDFDGWRKWKDNAIQNGLKDASNPRPGSVKKTKAAAAKEKLASAKEAKERREEGIVEEDGAALGGKEKGKKVVPGLVKEESGDTVRAGDVS